MAAFAKVRYGASTLLLRSAFRDEAFERALLGGIPELSKHHVLTPVKSAVSARVCRFVAPLAGQDRALYFKEYCFRSVWDILKHVARASRAKRAFRASIMLMQQGFHAPEIVAMGETWKNVIAKHSFLLTVEVPGSVNVLFQLSKDPQQMDSAALRRQRELIRTLGATVGRMHREGIVHGDLRLANVLACRCDHRWELYFLDNERTRKFPWLPPHLRLKNLVQVNMLNRGVTRTDRLRFFRAYLTACPRLHPCRKRWMRKVQARTLQRQRQ